MLINVAVLGRRCLSPILILRILVGKPNKKIKAYLADARLKLSEFPDTQEIVRLRVGPNIVKDMRNSGLDYPITTAVWAKHNRGRASSLINGFNRGNSFCGSGHWR